MFLPGTVSREESLSHPRPGFWHDACGECVQLEWLLRHRERGGEDRPATAAARRWSVVRDSHWDLS